jgi:hypothetical protein
MHTPGFSVHVDQAELAERDLAAALSPTSLRGDQTDQPAHAAEHHGARDSKQAARDRSERDHARTGAAGNGRSYAFRRS